MSSDESSQTMQISQTREDLLIIWDIENVRIPTELKPAGVLAALKRAFVKKDGRRFCGIFSACTLRSLTAMGPDRVDELASNGYLNVRMLHASGNTFRKTAGSDNLLIEIMLDFTMGCVLSRRRGTILLITGDADFVRPTMWCAGQGCSIELMFHFPVASREIKGMKCDWSMKWENFLRSQCVFPSNGPIPVFTFNYPPKKQKIAKSTVREILSETSRNTRVRDNTSDEGDSNRMSIGLEIKRFCQLVNCRLGIAAQLHLDDVANCAPSWKPLLAHCLFFCTGYTRYQIKWDTSFSLSNRVLSLTHFLFQGKLSVVHILIDTSTCII